ncbi:MAG TPA: LUD domain-containing protein [Pirellulales bacterium]|nr:LUD domain-containing protein [Pirellulales bacterium]
MTSKQAILDAIRRAQPAVRIAEQNPAPDFEPTTYADPLAQFARVLSEVGGHCVSAADAVSVNAVLAEMPAWTAGRKRLSLVAGVGDATFDLAAVADPHELEDVDMAIVGGEFAVAENGAVWVTDRQLHQRAILFIAQHLALVVPRAAIVNNLHEAYARLSFGGPGFGVFISGPSKTADIEQSLVIGAHGPRSLTVFLIGPPGS